ncbi:hypothetical protein WB388_08700 [Streptomyces brasiliscabiei]|uniref:Uncharacterized protein n=1 Tax=Streptomyces brasiliscabiei TaxID=2736302 RepID=A0ABU8G9S6_9ACTN
MRTPPRNPRPRDGELVCHGRTWPTDPPCDNPAAWHIAWLLAPRGHFSLVCEQHTAALAGVYDWVDRHPADIMCAMPGTGWLSGTQTSRCVLAPEAQRHEMGQQ